MSLSDALIEELERRVWAAEEMFRANEQAIELWRERGPVIHASVSMGRVLRGERSTGFCMWRSDRGVLTYFRHEGHRQDDNWIWDSATMMYLQAINTGFLPTSEQSEKVAPPPQSG